MKAGWEIKTLGEVYDVRDGTHDSPKYVEIGYPLITSKNLKYKGLSFDNVQYIAEEDYKKINARSAVHKGDVLFAMIGTIGNPTIVEIEPSFAIKNVALFKVPQVHSSGFLKYYLETEEVVSKMVSEAKGTTQKFVGLGYLRNFPIKIPALTEQQRIVAILDQAFEGIAKARANAEQNLQNARALFESHLQSVFTQRDESWQESTLGEVCNFVGGSQPPKSTFTTIQTADTVRLIQIRDYKSDKNLINIPRKLAKRFCNADDVMIGRYGPPLFQILRGLEGAYNVALMKAVPDDTRLTRDYLFYFLKHSAILNYVIYHSERAAGQIGLTKDTLEPYPISVPSLKEQAQIVDTIINLEEETQRLEALYQRKIACLDELKKSLLQQAFAGEL
jgi:type I restriction enzyme S subunit